MYNIENPSKQQTSVSLKKEALNCLEHLLVFGDIDVDKYHSLRQVVEMSDCNHEIPLGDGLKILIVDSK